MKKILAGLVFTAMTVPVFAQHKGHHDHRGWNQPRHGHYYHHRHWHTRHWVAPLIIGGVATYTLTRPDTVIIREQPVIVEERSSEVVPNCTSWREIQQPDGTIIRERTCTK